MRMITLEEPGRFSAGRAEAPAEPGAGEALVSVRRIGVCGTDYHAFRGRQPFFTYPRILGHELGVEVVAADASVDSTIRPGDRCAVEPYLSCGRCIACRNGKTNCCVELKVLGVHTDGGMREQICVPLSKLHPSSSLSLDQLALVETLGIGAHAADRARIQAGESALVIGAGPIGLSVMQFAKQAGARVLAIDTNESRLAFAQTSMGVDSVIAAGPDSLANVSALTDGDLPTVVFDATGNPESMRAAFEYVAHGGRLVFVGLFIGDLTFHDPLFHRREMTILSSRNSRPDDFRRIIGLMERGEIDTSPWITHRVPFDSLIPQFPNLLAPESRVLKAVIELD